jgi:hypothetical protein
MNDYNTLLDLVIFCKFYNQFFLPEKLLLLSTDTVNKLQQFHRLGRAKDRRLYQRDAPDLGIGKVSEERYSKCFNLSFTVLKIDRTRDAMRLEGSGLMVFRE